MNVHGGEESLRRRVTRERTHVERQTVRMYERREETWRRLNRDRVGAFVELYLMAMLHVENAHRTGRQHPLTTKMLNKTVVKRIIPWIYQNRVWVLEADKWPLSMEHFQELDGYLADHLPHVSARHQWQMVRYFYGEIKREQDRWQRLDRLEREAMEAYDRCMANLNN